MRRARSHSGLLWPGFTLLLSVLGCFPVQPSRFMVVEATRVPGGIDLTSAELERKCPSGVLVFGLSILKKDCERDCERWDLLRRDDPAPEDRRTKLPIRYGQEIPHVDVLKPARELAPGVYALGAEMGCYIDGEVIGERVFGRFEIAADRGAIRNLLSEE